MSSLDITEQYAEVIKQQALSVAKKFLPLIKERVDIDDLFSEANVGALEAMSSYDKERQPDLAKYIGIKVRFHLLRYAVSNMYDLEVPFSVQYKAWKRGETDKLAGNHALHIDHGFSFNGAEDEEGSFHQTIPASGAPVGDKMEREEACDVLMREFAKLHNHEQKVLLARHMGEKKVNREDLADSINVNAVTTAAIEKSALEKLRKRLKDKYGRDSY